MQTAPACASSHVCSSRRRPRRAPCIAFVDASPTVAADAAAGALTYSPPAPGTPAVYAAGAGEAAGRQEEHPPEERRGTIPLQDKFGLLLSVCSVLVSVQVLMPRVL